MRLLINNNNLYLIIANEPSQRRRSDGEAGQQNRAAQDWAIGRKILDRAEKSVTRKFVTHNLM